MGRIKRYFAAAIAAMMLIITYLHYSTNPWISTLHDLYREMYYIPVLLGALIFGLKGALPVYLFELALYLPYIQRNWTGDTATETNRLLHLFLQGIFAFIAGYLIDRERRHRTQLERERYLAGIGRGATAIVHDVQSPLIAIKGFAKRLKEGRGDVGTAAGAIIDSADHIEKIAHDVLDFARPIDLNLRKDDIRIPIERAFAVCRTGAEVAGVELVMDMPPHPIPCPIDSTRMERALVNLLNNAVEASKKGQVVSIRAEVRGDKMVIMIRDSGSGMDAETLENLFVPFYTKKSRGTGIGMSIAKKIIEGHKGTITVRSVQGIGTEISVELPADRE